jgi:hypothetical protein
MDAGGWYTTICSRMHARFQYFVSIQKPDARALQCRSRTVRCSREQRTRAPPHLALVAFFWHAPSPACPYSGRGGAPLPDWLASGAGLLLRCDGDAIDRSRLTQHDYQPASSSSPLPSLILASALVAMAVAACMHARSVRVYGKKGELARADHLTSLTGSPSGAGRGPANPCCSRTRARFHLPDPPSRLAGSRSPSS